MLTNKNETEGLLCQCKITAQYRKTKVDKY